MTNPPYIADPWSINGDYVNSVVGSTTGGKTDTVLPNGTNQTLPTAVFEAYKKGYLDKYLTTKYPSSSQIQEAYDKWYKATDIGNHPGAIGGGNNSSNSSSSNKTELLPHELQELLDRLHGKQESNFTETHAVIVNTPLAYITAVNAGILPSEEQMNPYMITINQNSGKQDYAALKELGVMAVCIDMGRYYTSNHTINYTFRQPKLETQIEAAKNADMPFGFYTTVCARTISEAEAELKEITLVIRRWPPSMGLWLRLNLTAPKYINDQIIKTYYNQFVHIGLKNQIGFYATKAQLTQISWSSFYNDWYLWLDEHIDSVEALPVPLTPEFFLCRDVS